MTSEVSPQGISQEAQDFLLRSIKDRYSYKFEWFSRPIIQYPQDIILMQEVINDVKPDLIILQEIDHKNGIDLLLSNVFNVNDEVFLTFNEEEIKILND